MKTRKLTGREREERKALVEKEAKAFLRQQILIEAGVDSSSSLEFPIDHYISEFSWSRGILYVAIDALSNPYPIAGINRGLYDIR